MTSPLSGLGLKQQPVRESNTAQVPRPGIQDLFADNLESLHKLYFIAKDGGDISPAIPSLVTLLKSRYFDVQSVTAQVLELFARNGGDITAAIPTLAEDFSHTLIYFPNDAGERKMDTIVTFAENGGDITPITSILERIVVGGTSSYPKIDFGAAIALGIVESRGKNVDSLVQALKNDNPEKREMAARGLIGFASDLEAIQPAIKELEHALFDEYRQVRRMAAVALKIFQGHGGRGESNPDDYPDIYSILMTIFETGCHAQPLLTHASWAWFKPLREFTLSPTH